MFLTLVRHARKTFRFRYAYGEAPIISKEQYEQEIEEGREQELKFKKVRFAHMSETCSSLYDAEYERFVRFFMVNSRKDLTYRIVDDAFAQIKTIQFNKIKKQQEQLAAGQLKPEDAEQIEMNPLTIFKQALKNSEPAVVTKPIQRGGATYQVPHPLQRSQSEWFAIKWIINAVKDRPKPKKKHSAEALAQELLDAFYGRGKVIKRRDDMHRLADANRAFAHYRWG